ncbi:CDP-diacylglycerol--serine O-phosphatidyltransferase [Leptospira kobayashii]|uniref:CDP-diacylglycerol--serine O-phosphatidyltransferase n=1 Tax=Leptospira kobayashii TaxID=1917830 RepID=A0ABN6KFD0_9LEPT|nr:CDP-alcohol phosphatidyltransferase family protein [Leptospira kobayashii]BDA78333.1 CDP-diacylglycerol--serine O-phosphatidyltransferase [Leptospira kobayashii]
MKKKLTWIPNTLTLGNLTLGFVSMLVASEIGLSATPSHELFQLAGVFIILAALFDGFDGMAARALDCTSELGADLDSLADLTTFGIAPGFLTYKMFLDEYKIDLFGRPDMFPVGMLIAALFPICAAYRLARFNVAHDPGSFHGLPSPVAGVVVGIFPLVFRVEQVPKLVAIAFFICTALLMVSTIRYSKPQVAIRGIFTWKRMAFALGGLALLVLAVGISKWPHFLYGAVGFYVFSGIVSFVIHTIQELRV